ncbi:beta-ketoacyl synthase chain length factor [Azospirillum agricola]|uniref:beta-ketoacyl synthase chain length factor n=1 Tax=Azospirillum agricola TaxID=1720247 RepID=UPI000A0F0755|nr:beta-ketoacyl synthase chain length factor [Azospirillum agricola]SMH36460.1 Beta-ketoacyl synthase, N-terminal domain [Azospirillum lipoferum]
MRAFIEGVGLLGPGLAGWKESRPVLAGLLPYRPAPAPLPPSPLLPPAERRRSVPTVKLAMAVGAEAMAQADRDPAGVATVFTSSSGDPDTLHQILETLASEDRGISPTRFHNSVHNAPAGYWSIATRSHAPSTSLSSHDESFQAGLLEAMAEVAAEGWTVGLIAYDLPYPEPLHAVRPIAAPFGMALVLTPEPTGRSFARLDIALSDGGGPPSRMADDALEALRAGNPTARALPLLAALARVPARGAGETVVLDLPPGGRLLVTVGAP